MTYFGFLAIFLGIPLVVLGLLTWQNLRPGKDLPQAFNNLSPWIALLVFIVLVLIYTMPWDNYLVATGVWYYDPVLVTGLLLGWVPIEEYTFFEELLFFLVTNTLIVFGMTLPIALEGRSRFPLILGRLRQTSLIRITESERWH